MSKQPKGEQRPPFPCEDGEECTLILFAYTIFILAVGVILGYALKGMMG